MRSDVPQLLIQDHLESRLADDTAAARAGDGCGGSQWARSASPAGDSHFRRSILSDNLYTTVQRADRDAFRVPVSTRRKASMTYAAKSQGTGTRARLFLISLDQMQTV